MWEDEGRYFDAGVLETSLTVAQSLNQPKVGRYSSSARPGWLLKQALKRVALCGIDRRLAMDIDMIRQYFHCLQ